MQNSSVRMKAPSEEMHTLYFNILKLINDSNTARLSVCATCTFDSRHVSYYLLF